MKRSHPKAPPAYGVSVESLKRLCAEQGIPESSVDTLRAEWIQAWPVAAEHLEDRGPR